MQLKFLKRLLFHPQTPAIPVRLCHATHLRFNLPQILKDGQLLSYSGLVERYGFENAMKYLHDRNRYDLQQTQFSDYINVSLGRVSSDYLFRLNGKSWRMEWVVFELNPKLLEWSNWVAAPAGAAKRDAVLYAVPNKVSREDALKKCFAKTVAGIERLENETIFEELQRFPSNVPTHPNCELLLTAPVGREHWLRIIVADAAMRQTARLIVENSEYRNLPVDIDKTVFYRHPSTKANNNKNYRKEVKV